MERGFHEEGLMLRAVGDSLAMSPPLIVSESQIGEIFEKKPEAENNGNKNGTGVS